MSDDADTLGELFAEDALEEIVTVEDYENIPDNITSPYLRGTQLWRHQRQAARCMLDAEENSVIVDENGESYESDFGVLGLPTGTGKTATALTVAAYSVSERKNKFKILYSALNCIKLKKTERPNIDVTVICTNEDILSNAWEKDIRNLFGGYEISGVGALSVGNTGMPYFKFTTMGKFEAEVKQSQEYTYFSNFVFSLKQMYGQWEIYLKANPQYQANFEVEMMKYDKDISTLADLNKFITKKEKELATFYSKLYNYKLAQILSKVKVAFVTNNGFQILLDFFKEYTVSRLMFDEPQKLVLRNQSNFENYIEDHRYETIRRHFQAAYGRAGSKQPTTFAEESPARFIWYVTATPHDIYKNVANHYINAWVARNDYMTKDFIKHDSPERRLLRKMVAKFVVRFPYSYIRPLVNPHLEGLCRKIVLKCKSRMESSILRGVLGPEVDQMLENDDLEGVLDKLSTGDGATDILTVALNRVLLDIQKLNARIQGYATNTPAHIIEESNKKLKSEIEKYNDLKKKIDIFRGTIKDEEVMTCVICMDDVEHTFVKKEGESPEEAAARFGVVHCACMNPFHYACLHQWLDKQKTCPTCRAEVVPDEIKPFNKKGVNNGSVEQQQNADLTSHTQRQKPHLTTWVENENYMNFDTLKKLYDDKIDALKDALKPIMFTPYGSTQPTFARRSKVLVFIEFAKQENPQQKQIIQTIQDAGFNVRLPFTLTKERIAALYPPRNGCSISVPKKDIAKEIDAFKVDPTPTVWLFRSVKESAGLNFEFVDTIICYSKFGAYRQILGRALRLTRRTHFDFITLSAAKDEEIPDSAIFVSKPAVPIQSTSSAAAASSDVDQITSGLDSVQIAQPAGFLNGSGSTDSSAGSGFSNPSAGSNRSGGRP